MSTFYPGQLVVCVDDSNVPGYFISVRKGRVYTVVAIEADCCSSGVCLVVDDGSRGEVATCNLCGFSSAYPVGCGFSPHRFVPIEPLEEEMDRIEESFIEQPEPEFA